MEVNAQSFLPTIGLKDAIQALTEPDVLMITALIGGKVPKHLFMTDRMETVPKAGGTASAATAGAGAGAAAAAGGGGSGGARNSTAAVTKQVLNRDAKFGSHASSLQSARMAASLTSTEASLLQLKAAQVLPDADQEALFGLLHDYEKGRVMVDYLVAKFIVLCKVSADRLVLVSDVRLKLRSVSSAVAS